MSEVLFDIYNDAYYAAMNSGASESDARAVLRRLAEPVDILLIKHRR